MLITVLAEHVFEGQLIGDFFTYWLAEGRLQYQLPAPSRPQAKWTCEDAEEYALKKHDWIVKNRFGKEKDESFFMVLLHELGSAAHLDGLTIFKARANGMKGAVRFQLFQSHGSS